MLLGAGAVAVRELTPLGGNDHSQHTPFIVTGLWNKLLS